MPGMLPTNVIEMLAAREKYVYFPCTVFIFFFNFADLIGYCRPFLLQANLLI